MFFDEIGNLKENAQALFDQFVEDVLAVETDDDNNNSDNVRNAIIKCLADRFGLEVPTTELSQITESNHQLDQLDELGQLESKLFNIVNWQN